MIRPAQTQQPTTSASATSDERAGRRACGRPARPLPTDRPASAMPSGTMSTKRRAKRAPACLARASLRPCVSWMRSSTSAVEAAVEVGAAELVGDEQRLAGGVGGRVGEPVLEHVERAGEVGGEQPLAVGGGERGAQLVGRTAADLEQGLRDRAAERAGEDADLLDHPRPGLLGPGPPVGAARPVGGERRRGGRDADGDRRARRRRRRRRPSGVPTTRSTHHHGGELAQAHVVEAGLGQPLLHHGTPLVRRGRPSGASPTPAPAERDGGVDEVHAERGGEGQEQAGHRSSCPLRASPGRATCRRGHGSRGSRAWSGTPSRLRRSKPASSSARAARPGRWPVHRAGRSRRARRKSSVTVNWVASGPAARSSTATISVTRGPSACAGAVHDDVDRLGHQGVERRHRELARGVGELADEAQPGERLAGRAGVDRGEALDARREREQQRQRLAVADLADDGDVGRHAEEAGDEPAQVDRAVGRRGRRGSACDATFGSGTSASKTSSAMTTRSDGSSSAAQQDSSVVLPEPGRAGEDDREPGPHARPQELGRPARSSMSRSTSSSSSRNGHAGELADVHHHVAAAADVAVDDVEPGAVVELRVLQALGRVELAVARRRRRRGSW